MLALLVKYMMKTCIHKKVYLINNPHLLGEPIQKIIKCRQRLSWVWWQDQACSKPIIQRLLVSSPATLFSEFWACRMDARVKITSFVQSVILYFQGTGRRADRKPLHEILVSEPRNISYFCMGFQWEALKHTGFAFSVHCYLKRRTFESVFI